MKWMTAADIHGSEYYCRKLLEAYEKEKAGRLLLLGDILYHGPRNDLPPFFFIICRHPSCPAILYKVRGMATDT